MHATLKTGSRLIDRGPPSARLFRWRRSASQFVEKSGDGVRREKPNTPIRIRQFGFCLIQQPSIRTHQHREIESRGETLGQVSDLLAQTSGHRDLDRHTAPVALDDDVLRTIPGPNIPFESAVVAHYTSNAISMRGIGGYVTTLVLVDGVPIDDPMSGYVQWMKVPMELGDRHGLSGERGCTLKLSWFPKHDSGSSGLARAPCVQTSASTATSRN